MLAIEITNVHTFDVLLTSGDARSSSLNKLAQSFIRRGKDSPYSHAAIFFSPFLVAESLDTPGIVLTDLFRPHHNPHGSREASPEQRSHIVARLDGPKIRLFALLPGVNAAAIYRYLPLKDTDGARIATKVASMHISVFEEAYLAQYPAYIRLAATAGIIPAKALSHLERAGRVMEKKGITGPFCSELVALMLADAHPLIFQRFESAENVAPSDYKHADIFEMVVNGEHGIDFADNKIDGLLDTLDHYLRLDSVDSQAFNSKLVQLSASLSSALSKEEDIREYYARTRRDLRNDCLRHVSEHIVNAAKVSEWLIRCNECAETCPSHRNGPNLQCADIRYCSAFGWPTWSKLEKGLREKYDARLKADVERASAKVKSWSADNLP